MDRLPVARRLFFLFVGQRLAHALASDILLLSVGLEQRLGADLTVI